MSSPFASDSDANSSTDQLSFYDFADAETPKFGRHKFWTALSGPSGREFAKFVVKSSRPSAVLDDKECKMLLNRVLPEFCYAMTTVDVDNVPNDITSFIFAVSKVINPASLHNREWNSLPIPRKDVVPLKYEHTITADDLNNAPHLDVQFPSKAVIQKSMTPAFEKKRKHRSSSPPDDAESISTKKAGKAKAKDAPKSLVQGKPRQDESDDEDMEDNPQPLSHVIKAKTKTKDDEKSRPKTSNEDDDVTAGPSGRSVRQSTKDQTAKTTKSTKVKTTKYARTPDLGTRFPLSESRAPPTNNAAHEIHHIYTASTANDDGPWTPGTLQLLPFYHYNIDSIRQLLSGPLGRASPGNEDLLYAFIPRLHTIARASAPYNNDIEITNLTIAPPKLFRRPAAHRPRASLAPQQTGYHATQPLIPRPSHATHLTIPPKPDITQLPAHTHPTPRRAPPETTACFVHRTFRDMLLLSLHVPFVGTRPHPHITFVNIESRPHVAFVGTWAHPHITFVDTRPYLHVVCAPPLLGDRPTHTWT
ncbi:hypothetical protein B0H11DRAFT_2266213 [Mycena galericulata]|nr:hypothetical protein B0H11DRAFT_2266213 [Mycena galericulata]